MMMRGTLMTTTHSRVHASGKVLRYWPLMDAAMPFCRLSTVASHIASASSTTTTPTQLLTVAEPAPGPEPRICCRVMRVW
jgi:hypothetical protein